MKKIFLCIAMIIVLHDAFAISLPYNTVSLDHRVYKVLENLELRGILYPLPNVKPFTRKFVSEQLDSALSSSIISNREKRILHALREELSLSEGNSLHTVLNRGSLMFPAVFGDNSIISIGVQQDSLLTFSLLDLMSFDSRNSVSGYVEGDITQYSSFHIEAGLRYDQLNSGLWPGYTFSTPGEGQYIIYSAEGNQDSQGEGDFALSFLTEPEVTISLADDKIKIRWGMFKRDWGNGYGNLAVSETARTFDAVEAHITFTDWLKYYYMTGTLTAPKILASIGGYGRPDMYQNMLTIKRLEFFPHKSLQFAVFENVLWPKRFELGYLNPFMISTIYQNTIGDYDNMFAGADFSLKPFNGLEFYGSIMIDEIQSLNVFSWFDDPRSIFGSQLGLKGLLPFMNFTTIGLQYTRLEPFFYTHRPINHPSIESQTIIEITEAQYTELDEDGYMVFQGADGGYFRIVDKDLDLSYTNKLENLGFHLPPNSDELTLKLGGFLRPELYVTTSGTYIRHSDQYGDTITSYMDYGIDEAGGYADKDFSGHLVEHSLIGRIYFKYTLSNMPVALSASYSYRYSWEREASSLSAWETHTDHLFSLGVSVN